MSPRDDLEALEEHDPERIAEQQLLHGLLRTVSEDERAREVRLEQLFGAINAGRDRVPKRGARRLALSLAATLLLTSTVLFLFLRSTPAHALVRDALIRARESGERVYSLTASLEGLESALPIAGELDVADADHVVLTVESPSFSVVTGRD